LGSEPKPAAQLKHGTRLTPGSVLTVVNDDKMQKHRLVELASPHDQTSAIAKGASACGHRRGLIWAH
jgi:hypothetical protein